MEQPDFCRSLLLPSLQQTCQHIQDIIADPLQVILHRSKCCSLAKAYALGVQEVQDQIHKALTDCHTHALSHNLAPSLTALLHTMAEGEKFIRDCRRGMHWLKKALTLALSTEAVDVHFHGLLWSISVINAAVGRNLEATTDEEYLQDIEVSQLSANGRIRHIYDLLDNAKSESSGDEDLALVLRALEGLKATNMESGEAISSKDHRFIDFIFDRLSNRPVESVSWGILPPHFWVDRQEFQILGSLGCGGYAAVYKVEWLGEQYAMKEFASVGSLACSDSNDLFQMEAAIQARLHHPNILQLICCTETPDGYNCGLVMELMQQDLRSLINRRLKQGIAPPFSLPIAVDIILQIAKGMEYLHSLHIMHRDLKSMNILVSPDQGSSGDGRVRVKISDFGMSKAKYMSSKYTTMHTGTSYWRAPEVFESKAEETEPNAKYTKKADVYSFAMVCYEIFSGQIPFKDIVSPSKLHKALILGVRPRLPSSCPQILARYIANCWHADPSRRPTFAEISRALLHLKGVLLTFDDPMFSLTLSDPVVAKLMELMDADHTGNSAVVEMEETAEDDLLNMQDEHLSLHFRKLSPLAADRERPFVKAEEKSIHMKGKRKRTMVRLLKRLSACVLCNNRSSVDKEPAISSLEQQPGGAQGLADQADSAKQFGGSEVAKRTSDIRMFTFDELRDATKNFSKCLGQGGFGAVFLGQLQDGQDVAVKRILDIKEVETTVVPELMTVGLLRHDNLVPLRGWCFDLGDWRSQLLLVYDFMPNGSLEKYLYGGEPLMLAWEKRLNIACGLGAALHCLHHECGQMQVLHRDVKPSNVLLDEEFNARLGDFGLAKLLEEKQEERHSSRLVGTIGFLAPEYAMSGEYGTHSDVYSFGIVILELACGRRVIERGRPPRERNLLQWLSTLDKSGRLMLDAPDPRLQGAFNTRQMKSLLQLGRRCTEFDSEVRPTMAKVLPILHGLKR